MDALYVGAGPTPVAAAAGAFSLVTSAAVLLDPDGRIREAGAVAAAMLGYEPPDLIGRSLVELAASDWRDVAAVAVARIRFGATESFELMMQGRSGRLSLVEMAARPIAPTQARPAAFLLAWSTRLLRREAAHAAVEEELRELSRALLRLREEERLDLARRLHDDLAHTVVMAKFLIEGVAQRYKQKEDGESSSLLGRAAASLRDVVSELFSISTALRPRLLDDLGLLPTLEWYCRGFERANPAMTVVRVLTADERDVSAGLKLEIFRIVQDALSNVARHAQATMVRLTLLADGGKLYLGIEDNGSGFDLVQTLRSGRARVGLPSIEKRVSATGGRMVLDSGPQRGTRISATWPIDMAPPTPENGDASYYRKRAAETSIHR